MSEQLKLRLEKIERANENLRKAKERAKVIARNFGKDKDFVSFLSATTEGAGILNAEFNTNPLILAVYITDELAYSWSEGNGIILEEAREHGIIPGPNVYGERLEAMDCLSRLIDLDQYGSSD